MEKQSRREIADALKLATSSFFLKKGFSCFYELGLMSWGKLRGDVVCINLKGEIVIAEIKSSEQDYKLDTKWEKYLPFCNKMYFVMLPSVFDKIKTGLDAKAKTLGVGVLVLDGKTGYLRSTVPAKYRKMKKKAKRLLTIRMAWRNGEVSRRNSRRKRQFISE